MLIRNLFGNEFTRAARQSAGYYSIKASSQASVTCIARKCSLKRESIPIEQLTLAYKDETVEALRIGFSPFIGDVYLAEKPEYTNAAFSITFSDSVPGGVVRVAVLSRQDDVFYFEREIVIE